MATETNGRGQQLPAMMSRRAHTFALQGWQGNAGQLADSLTPALELEFRAGWPGASQVQ